MDNISLRIKELIDEKKLNISSFEKKIGAGNNSIGTIITRNSNVSGTLLSKILNTFTDVSAQWLLTGKGNMLNKNATNNEVSEPGPDYIIENKLLNSQKKTIEVLETVVTDLRNDKKLLHEIIKNCISSK